MLSNLSDLFKKLEQGDETVAAILIDQLDVDLGTETETGSLRRSVLDAVLRAPTRALYDRALDAFMTRGLGRHPEAADQAWSRWLRNSSFNRETYSRDSRSSREFEGALVSAMEGLRPWAIEEILRQEALMVERGVVRAEDLPERTTASMLALLTEHGVGRHTDGIDFATQVLDVLKTIHRHFPGTVEDWMTPVSLGYGQRPAAFTFAGSVDDRSVVQWLVEEVGVPVNVQDHEGRVWVNALHGQRDLDGIEWLLSKGYDWHRPMACTDGFNIDFPENASLSRLLNIRASEDLGPKPEHYDRAQAWEWHTTHRHHAQRLVLRYDVQHTNEALPRLDRPRL